MDAISFVLGIKSSHLRSSNLRDLVYRGRVLRTSKINGDGSATNRDEAEDREEGRDDDDANAHDVSDGEDQTQGERNDPQEAWVMAVYEDDAGEEQRWKRSITRAGVSE